MASLDQLQRLLGYEFQNQELLSKALTHKSRHSQNNERLEFLGDSILGAIISTELFSRFPNSKEGDLTKLRSRLVRGQTLAKLSKEMDIQDYIQLGQGEMKSGGYRRESILADTLEAIIAAIYQDSDFYKVKNVVLGWYETKWDDLSVKDIKDPKTSLQELLQKQGNDLPVYSLVGKSGPDHNPSFRVDCSIPNVKETFMGEGGSRRDAEQSAAKNALEFLSL